MRIDIFRVRGRSSGIWGNGRPVWVVSIYMSLTRRGWDWFTWELVDELVPHPPYDLVPWQLSDEWVSCLRGREFL